MCGGPFHWITSFWTSREAVLMIRRLVAATALTASILAVAACTPGSSQTSGNPFSKPAPAPTPDPDPIVKVVDDAQPGENLQLTVTGGEFVSVKLTDDKHKSVPADTGTYKAAAPSSTDASTPADGSTPATDSSDTADASTDSATDAAVAGGTAETPESTSELGSSNAGSTTTPAQSGTPQASADSSTDPATSGATDTNPKGTTWTSNYTLAGAADYTYTATTVTPDGKTHTATGHVETTKPTGEPMRLSTVLADDANVGVGAPLIFNFAGKIPEEYRAGIESRMTLTVTDDKGKPRKVEGSWAWLPDDDGHSRIHYRPKEYWPEHSKVHVDAPLKDVPFSKDSFGAKDMTLDVNIDRNQIVVADAKTHTMKVTRDGKVIMDFPASLGSPQAPSYNGIHIVMSKSLNYTMTSDRWGYTTPVTHAVRLHNNGEFIHAAPWSVGAQGNSNVSHGCVNLSTANAAEYYKTAIYGDPVVIQGSSVNLSTKDSDVKDWVYTWDQWKDLSALA